MGFRDMRTIWLVTNNMSRTTDRATVDQVCDILDSRDFRVERLVDLGQGDLPDSRDLPDIVACLGGDGTANAIVDHYGDKDVELLVLPGGTMNLLARKLHGEADIPAIIAEVAERERIVRLPQIAGPGFHSLVGVIAGATAAWGDVREALRSGDVETIVGQARLAFQSTLSPPSLSLEGQEKFYNALFIEPLADAMRVQEIKADTLYDIAQHGWAWLNRDFLGGPLAPLVCAAQIALRDQSGTLELLVDGERLSAAAPLSLRSEMCPARFLAALQS